MSLLLDALKKAAEQKLKNENSAAESSAPDAGALKVPAQPHAESTQTLSTVESPVDPTLFVEDGETRFELPKEFDETTTYGLKRSADVTEFVRSNEGPLVQTRNNHSLELPEISAEYDLTLQTAGTTYTAGGMRNQTETAQSGPVSMTGNFRHAEDHYHDNRQAAAQMFISKKPNKSGKGVRFWILLTLAGLGCLLVGGMFVYDYLAASVSQDVAMYHPRRLQSRVQKNPQTQPDKNNTQNATADAIVDPELKVEKTDYTTIFAEETRKQKPSEEPARNSVAIKPAKSRTASEIHKPRSEAVVMQDTLSVLVTRAYTAFQSGDYVAAADLYAEANTRAPDNRDVQLGMAAVSLKQHNYPKARLLYQQLLASNPQDASAIAGLAAAGLLRSTHERSLDESKLKQMLREQPESHQLYFTLGNLYARQKRWADAEHAYFLAYQGGSENPDYAFNLAISLEHLGQNESALQYYQAAVTSASRRAADFSVETAQERILSLQQQSSPK